MSTIRDVAQRAGVSTMTVSRVLNRSGYISEPTRQRVEQAIADLGYVPNALARSLRFKHTRTLALVLTDITNPFFTTIARGVEDVASENGFNVIFCNTDESPAEEARQLSVLVQKQTDGVLLVPAHSSAEPVTFLRSQKVPVVVLDRRVSGPAADVVRCDSEAGAFGLVSLLLRLGHRRIAVLSGPAEVSTAADRVAGYRRALASAGVAEDARLVEQGQLSLNGGYQMAHQVLGEWPQPTALFAANNFIAIGAYRALRDAGLRVPEDLAMVSFDDLPPAMVMDPFLTVVAQPAYEMGRRATELLLARLSGGGPQGYQEIILPTELIERQSSGGFLGGPSGAQARGDTYLRSQGNEC